MLAFDVLCQIGETGAWEHVCLFAALWVAFCRYFVCWLVCRLGHCLACCFVFLNCRWFAVSRSTFEESQGVSDVERASEELKPAGLLSRSFIAWTFSGDRCVAAGRRWSLHSSHGGCFSARASESRCTSIHITDKGCHRRFHCFRSGAARVVGLKSLLKPHTKGCVQPLNNAGARL